MPRLEGARLEDMVGRRGMEDAEGIWAHQEVVSEDEEVEGQVEDDVRARRGRPRRRGLSRCLSGSSTLRCGMSGRRSSRASAVWRRR